MAQAADHHRSGQGLGRQRRHRRPGAERPAAGARGDGAARLRGREGDRLSRRRPDHAAPAARTCRSIGSASCCRSPNQAFYQAFARELGAGGQRSAELPRHRADRLRRISQAPAEIAAKLRDVWRRAARRSPGRRPTIRRVTAAVEELKEKGIPVFSLLSDFAAGVREGYVGLDNRKVGRTAAWMIAKAREAAGQGRHLRRQPPLSWP